MNILKHLLAPPAAIALVATAPVAQAQARSDKPNIILILLDNFGYGELGTYGGGELRGAATPRIDSLARDGMKLTNFNTETTCSPSRSALLTRRFPVRSGTQILANAPEYGLAQWEITVPEMLMKQGYVSALYGKWHLGIAPGRQPNAQGFDEWYGILRSNDEAYWQDSVGFDPTEADAQYIYEGPKGEKSKIIRSYDPDMRTRIDGEVTRFSIDFIDRQAKSGKPFFLYAPMTAGHWPRVPSPEWKGRTGHGPWADVLAQTDQYVGEILDAIKAAGIEQNTIVIFTADNGTDLWYHDGSGPWRGNMATTMEGGLRVPFLIRWPGHVSPGSQSNEIVQLVDIFPTFASITGGNVPTDRVIDGVDQSALLLGKQQNSNRDFFPIYVLNEIQGAKWKNWKLHYREQIYGTDAPQAKGKLVDLLSDPIEESTLDPDSGWIGYAIGKRIAAFQQSLKDHPPIKPGTPDPYVPNSR